MPHPVRPRLAELGRFLTARRAEIPPERVGLPAAGRRRTPGLRREEVALLAGVGVSWYTWMEQGRAEYVSPEVLDAVARVLLLDESQRRYLRRLAGAPIPPSRPEGRPGPEALRPFVDNWLPAPAYVADRGWNVVVANRTAAQLLHIDSTPYNLLRAHFLDERVQAAVPDWPERAPELVARFRGQAAEHAAEEGIQRLITELSAASPHFAQLWQRHEVREDACGVEILTHPSAGDLHFERATLDFTPRLGVRLTVLLPLAGTGTDVALCELMSQRSGGSGSADGCRKTWEFRAADPSNLLAAPPC